MEGEGREGAYREVKGLKSSSMIFSSVSCSRKKCNARRRRSVKPSYQTITISTLPATEASRGIFTFTARSYIVRHDGGVGRAGFARLYAARKAARSSAPLLLSGANTTMPVYM